MMMMKFLIGLGFLTLTAGSFRASAQVSAVEVRTIEDLAAIGSDLGGSYVLVRDLDFTDGDSYASGVALAAYQPSIVDGPVAGFAPIGGIGSPFTGSFDGGGFVIRNLYVRRYGAAALFGQTEGATILNLGLERAFVSGRAVLHEGDADGEKGYVGVLIGEMNGGRVQGCYALGLSESIGRVGGRITSYAGGLIGLVGDDAGVNAAIEDSYASVGVSSAVGAGSHNSYAGGLIGSVVWQGEGGIIRHCYAEGSVSSTGNGNYFDGEGFAGGLIGRLLVERVGDGRVTVENCRASGNVNGDYRASAFVGGVFSDGKAAEKEEEEGEEGEEGEEEEEEEEAEERGTFLFKSCHASGDASVVAFAAEAYVGGLIGRVGFLDGRASLDLFLELEDCTSSGSISGVANFPDIADRRLPSYSGGLIGRIRTGVVLRGCSVTGPVRATGIGHVGGLIGQAGSSTLLTNCYVTGDMIGGRIRNIALLNFGGLVGWLGSNPSLAGASSTIRDCYTSCRMTNLGGAGGLVGRLASPLTIENSYTTGSINGSSTTGGLVSSVSVPIALGVVTITNCYTTGAIRGTTFVGGLVGRANAGILTVTGSYTTGAVHGSIVGGLVGQVGSGLAAITTTLTRSYSTGAISGSASRVIVGGLVGSVLDIATFALTYCHFSGSVSGGVEGATVGYFGGLAGRIDPNDAIFSNNYATGDVMGTSASGSVVAGGLIGYMKSSLSNCYAAGTVSTSSGTGFAASAGLVGDLIELSDGASIADCYAVAALSSSSGVGRNSRHGLASGTAAVMVTNSYWDSEVSGAHGSLAGSLSGHGGTVQTTDELQAQTYITTNWSPDVWSIRADHEDPRYPTLQPPPALETPLPAVPPTDWSADAWDLSTSPPSLRPPPLLTPALVGGDSFTVRTSGSPATMDETRTYTHTISNVPSGGGSNTERPTVSYTLTGVSLSNTMSVDVRSVSDPATSTPFTSTIAGNFRSLDGLVPMRESTVEVQFFPPVVEELTTYTHTITYTNGGLANAVRVRIMVEVLPTPTLTPTLVVDDGGDGFSINTTPERTTYTHTISGVPAGGGSNGGEHAIAYTFTGTDLSSSIAVEAVGANEPAVPPTASVPATLFTLTNAESFTSLDGTVPTGQPATTVQFVPPVVEARTIYTYSITYTGGNLLSPVQVRLVVEVLPRPLLEPTFIGVGDFTETNTGSLATLNEIRTYTHTTTDVPSGDGSSAGSRSLSYLLIGTALAPSVEVEAVAVSDPLTNSPFTLNKGGSFTSLNGTVPATASTVEVGFVPPAVEEQTTYTYVITYTGGNLLGAVQVRLVVEVLPPPPPPPSLTPVLFGGSFVPTSTPGRTIYTHAISNVPAAGESSTVAFTLTSTDLSTVIPIEVVTLSEPLIAGAESPFTLKNRESFTSLDGTVPTEVSGVEVAFVPPVIEEQTTYTYAITYTGGGLVGSVRVVLTAEVLPTILPPSPILAVRTRSPLQTEGVVLSPNPTSGYCRVAITPTGGFLADENGSFGSLTLLDLSGVVVFSTLLTEADQRLDLSHLPAGLYVARITTPSGSITRRLLKTN